MAAASVCTRALQAFNEEDKNRPFIQICNLYCLETNLPCPVCNTHHTICILYLGVCVMCVACYMLCLDVCAPGFPPRTSQLWLVFIFFPFPGVSIYICVGTRQTALEM